jgi:cytochrome c oxidase subunit 2
VIAAFTAVSSVLLFAQGASASILMPESGDSPNSSLVTSLYLIVYVIGLVAVIALIASLARGAKTATDADAPAPTDGESAKKAFTAGIVLFVLFVIVGAVAFSKTSSAKPSLSGTGSTLTPHPYTDPSLITPHTLKPPKGPSTTIHVNGQQYLWRYDYGDVKGKWNTYSYHDMVIPVGVTVLLDVTSSDVEHAWWAPQLGGSIDALPGYINKGWIRADKAGVYTGASTVISGTNYANMTTNVIAVAPLLYRAWVSGKQIEITEAMAALGAERASGAEALLITGAKTSTTAGSTGSTGAGAMEDTK